MSNIPRTKDNQAAKFGLLEEYNVKNIFIKNDTENVPQKLVPDFFFQKKHYIRSKQVVFALDLMYFGRSKFEHKIETNCIRFRLLIQRYTQI